MISSFGMYDFGPAMAANDRFWDAIRDHLRAHHQPAPDALTRGDAAYWPAWESPDLTLSQTCGYPFRARLHDKVTLIASPDYGLPGCPPGHYRSVFIARREDPRNRIEDFDAAAFAYNEDLSQSGWAAPVTHMTGLGMTITPTVRSGGHRRSAQAVSDKQADFAALDALTWAMMEADAKAALKVIGHTTPTPALPFIAAKGADRLALLAALRHGIAQMSAEDRATLHLQGVVQIPAEDYLAVPTPPPPAHFCPAK